MTAPATREAPRPTASAPPSVWSEVPSSSDEATGPQVVAAALALLGAGAALLCAGRGQWLAAAAIVGALVAVHQLRRLDPHARAALDRAGTRATVAMGRGLSYLALAALFAIVVLPAAILGATVARRWRRPFDGPGGWSPHDSEGRWTDALPGAASMGFAANDGESPELDDRLLTSDPRRGHDRPTIVAAPRIDHPARALAGRVAVVLVVVVVLDVVAGNVLAGTGALPGGDAVVRERQEAFWNESMGSEAMADAPWVDEYRQAGLELFFGRRDYQPYLVWGFEPYESPFLNTTAVERRSYRPTSASGADPIRIAFFGGSAMFGWGQRDDHTIPSELARLAEAEGVPVEVHNFGMYGWVAWQEYQYLERLLAAGHEFDLAVFYDGINDVSVQQSDYSPDPTHGGTGVLRKIGEQIHDEIYTKPGFFDGAVDLARTYRENSATARVVDRVLGRDRELPDWLTQPATGTAVDQTAAALDVYRRSQDAVLDLADRYDLPVRFFWQPMRQPWAPEILEGLPARTTDLSSALDDVDEPVWIDEGHTNEVGARLVATDLWAALRADLPPRAG